MVSLLTLGFCAAVCGQSTEDRHTAIIALAHNSA
jgi:hypothetical protein